MFILFMGRCVMLQVTVTHACMISAVTRASLALFLRRTSTSSALHALRAY